MELIKVLIIVTSYAQMGNSNEQTGVWLEELATPYYEFVDAGFTVDIVSIKGGIIPIDPSSFSNNENSPESVKRFQQDVAFKEKVNASTPLVGVRGEDYDVVVLPGGHGTMWDLPDNQQLSHIVANTLKEGKIVAAICHGPAGLVSATNDAGESVVKGKRITAFSDAEENAVGLSGVVPFLLQTRLESLGAIVETGPNFESFVVRDGNLITGQNPASSKALATLVIEVLKQKNTDE
jgi:putative intracellular protease/amidase